MEDDDPEGWEIVRAAYPHTGKAEVVGFTGPPGAGKSTLIGALVKHKRAQDRDIAVLSIDPSSPFRGGALLGDRIRLTDHFLDPGVFIRSMATRGALGGLAEAALQAALLMDAAGKDDVFLETVGVGQAEVDVIDHADTIVLVLIPGSGDSIQALKAGVMEIPDIIVVNKADHPMTDTMVREIRGVLSLGDQRAGASRSCAPRPTRARASSSSPRSSPSTATFVVDEGQLAERRRRNLLAEVIGIATHRLRRALEASARDDEEIAKLLDQVVVARAGPGQRGLGGPHPRRLRRRRSRARRPDLATNLFSVSERTDSVAVGRWPTAAPCPDGPGRFSHSRCSSPWPSRQTRSGSARVAGIISATPGRPVATRSTARRRRSTARPARCTSGARSRTPAASRPRTASRRGTAAAGAP